MEKTARRVTFEGNFGGSPADNVAFFLTEEEGGFELEIDDTATMTIEIRREQ